MKTESVCAFMVIFALAGCGGEYPEARSERGQAICPLNLMCQPQPQVKISDMHYGEKGYSTCDAITVDNRRRMWIDTKAELLSDAPRDAAYIEVIRDEKNGKYFAVLHGKHSFKKTKVLSIPGYGGLVAIMGFTAKRIEKPIVTEERGFRKVRVVLPK